MTHDTNASHVAFARLDPPPRALTGAATALVLIGGAIFAATLLTNPARAWHAYLFNWLFFLSVAQGAVMLAVIVSITRGAWSRPVRRFALSFSAFLPLAWLLMLPMFFAADHIFPWLHEPVPGKEAYLNLPFLVLRNTVLLAALVTLTLAFAYFSLRPDLGLLRDRAGRADALWERMTRGWRGQAAEERASYRALAKLGPAIGLVWALAFSIVAWDFVMSLEPHWFSTLLGPYYFMAGLLGGLAATGIASRAFTRRLGVPDAIATSQWHDLGKLTFGFVVFWAYLFFSQYIVIWYGLLPGEQSFVIHRFVAPFGSIARIVFLFMFVIPFFGLLGAAPKQRPAILNTFGAIILTGLWFERFLLVYPSHNVGAENLPLGWQEIGTAMLFGGLLLASLAWFARRFPMFQHWVPQSELELAGLPVVTEEPALR